MLEYVGILTVLGGLLAALVVAFSPAPVAQGAREAVCLLLGGAGCGSADGLDQAADDQGDDEDEGDGAGAATTTEDAAEDSADQAGGTPSQDDGCQGFWGCAGAGLSQVGSGVYNVGKGAYDEVVGIGELVMDPGKVVDGVAAIIDDPRGAAEQIVWDDESRDMWEREDYGGAVGRTVWNVGSFFIPGVGVAKAGGKAGDLGRLGGLADDLAAVASRVDDAIARGDLDEAAELAADARRQADELEDQARRQGCLSAGLPGAGMVLAGGGRGATGLVLGASSSCDTAGDAAQQADEAADAAEEAVEEALQEAGSPVRGDIPPGLDRGELGLDPAVGHFRQAEYDTALRVQDELGVRLERAEAGGADWVDSSGRTYDAVGNFPSRFFDQQWPTLQGRIVDHLAKADVVPVDVSQFTPAQVAQVREYVESLPRAQRDRIRVVGGG